MKKTLLAVAFAAAFVPAVASAKTYDIATGYGTSDFSYGSGTAGTFTPFPFTYSSGCFGSAALACQNTTPNNSSSVAAVVKNTSANDVGFAGTVILPAGQVMIHPGVDTDAVLRFNASKTATYTFSGAFTQYDQVNGGNGTIRTISSLANPSLYSATTDGKTVNGSTPFLGRVRLNAGDALDFRVNNKGSYEYDSTGVSGTISFVPEPATWIMMIIGFGTVGATLRRRKTVSGVAFA